MAWVRRTRNNQGVQTETITQAASATYVYSSVIDFLKLRNDGNAQNVTLFAAASAVAGTNIDISLWGATTPGGTKFLLVDAPGSIADLTNAAKTAAASFNLASYPAPYYFIGMLADTNESANTVTLEISPEYPVKK